ncbi:nuclear transport factor 2 family protein [Pyxidicoccus sp. MSG2]|uniref:nuclear transport factor 2 family protein n=1 Tax=Pyxidicoccus sp. MSG2 TaxID=2996790 RepID=UPI00226F1E93|nr:nuclear transport factor 2 family protein [Pyxidicoccus sp. MSG2]MCY1023338.1 nuclear transport factor 2 family protein [Pyxidicoccus sp. MSG2]
MTRTLGGVVAVLLSLLATPVWAQDAAAGGAPADVEATHNALRALKQDMEDALNTQDVDRLVKHLTPDVVFTTMNNDVRVGKDAIRAYYDEMMRGPNRVVEKLTAKFEVDDLTHLYGNTGVAWGSSKDHYVLTDGTDIVIDSRWTCTLVRQGDQWLISAFHYSTNVFDNPLLSKLKYYGAIFISVATLGALLAGFVIGRTRRPKATA